MDYFKFTCPHCQTRIGTSPDTVGEHVSCPSCNGDVIIPPAPATEGEVVAGIAPETGAAAAEPHEAAEHTMMLRRSDLEPPPAAKGFEDEPNIPDMSALNDDNPFGAPTPPPAPKPKVAAAKPEPKPEPKPVALPPTPKIGETGNNDDDDEPSGKSAKKKEVAAETLIGNLTPEVKVGILRQARSHIDDESKWIHGRSGPGGKHVLAAHKNGDAIVPEKPGSPTATHYSIVGALVVAMDEIRVKSTAGGRSEFLHQEIENATRKVTGKGETDKVDPMDLQHHECLAVLDRMLKHYQKMLGDSNFEKLLKGAINPAGGDGSTSELGAMLSAEDDTLNLKDIIRAVMAEIDQLKKRIDQLENK